MVIKNEQGITLVELLGVLAILSIVIVLIGSAHLFGQRQFYHQTDQIDKQGEVRLVVSQLTTDLRKVTAESVSQSEGIWQIGTNRYRHHGDIVYRNDHPLSDAIEIFDLTLLENGAAITIKSIANKQGRETEISTTIYYRK
ncbi:PilW family protein [Amphibacillus jilinensis]|uniref:PilW family protein n=1 Tax=Amphibacillus jilinensis TaxID=1216008 RepID=UPI00037DEC7F|nr:prepilin-type N-terminal cleavage/methylation domain-containing protein [Amphibacillus jilinensis]